jgi:Flp pilus assembly protein TadG
MIHSSARAKTSQRHGVVLPATAFAMVVLIGVTAIVMDGGLLLADKRQCQSAADAAALAAAIDLFENFEKNYGADPSGTAATSAAKTATDNGFTDGVNGKTVKVNIPPVSGPSKDQPGYAEVIVTMQQKRYFSRIFGSGELKVTARAVARGTKFPKNNGLIVLKPSGASTVTNAATGNITVKGGNVIVNSSDAKAGAISNTGSIVADNQYFTGTPGFESSGAGQFTAVNGKLYSNQTPTPNPLKDLPAPLMAPLSYKNVNIAALPIVGGAIPGWPDPDNPLNGWILPATGYLNGLHITDTNPDHVYTLQSGIFYLSSGGLSVTGSATVRSEANGVLLYVKGGGVNINTNGPLTLAPLKAGTYKDVTLFQDAANTSQSAIGAQAKGSLSITGTVYMPAAKLTLNGSGANYAVGSQHIVYELGVTGSGNFLVDYGQPLPPTRNLYLVE